MIYHLVIEQFAMENGPWIVDLPIKNGDYILVGGLEHGYLKWWLIMVNNG